MCRVMKAHMGRLIISRIGLTGHLIGQFQMRRKIHHDSQIHQIFVFMRGHHVIFKLIIKSRMDIHRVTKQKLQTMIRVFTGENFIFYTITKIEILESKNGLTPSSGRKRPRNLFWPLGCAKPFLLSSRIQVSILVTVYKIGKFSR